MLFFHAVLYSQVLLVSDVCASPLCAAVLWILLFPFEILFFCLFVCFFLPIRLQLSVSQSVFRCAASRSSPKALLLISYFCSASGLETR